MRPQGMNWNRRDKRCAIYARDEFRCVFCGAEPDQMQLDHLTPISEGGTNDEDNLVTCCNACNEAKGEQCFDAYCRQLEARGTNVRRLRQRVAQSTFVPIDRALGKRLEARRTRGSFSSLRRIAA